MTMVQSAVTVDTEQECGGSYEQRWEVSVRIPNGYRIVGYFPPEDDLFLSTIDCAVLKGTLQHPRFILEKCEGC